MRTLWRSAWLYVCRSSLLPSPLSYRTIEIGDESIVILRDAQGALKAYHNVCRHRGSLLCTEREGRLASKLLVCPYHQWSYAAEDGRLVRTSSFAEPKNFDRADHPLFKVALTEWRGCIFVNLDPQAECGDTAAFPRSPEALKRFPLEDMVVGHVWRKELACNWKVFWENANECLHCPNVHPELSALVPLYARRIIDVKDLPDWPEHEDDADPKYRGGLRQGAETWSCDGSAQGHTISTLSAEDLARGQAYVWACPGMYIAGYADHARAVRVLPLGPERTELVAEWLFEREALDDPAYDPRNVIDFETLVMEQDSRACELNQIGLRTARFEKGVLMPEEYVLKRFHDWVRNAWAAG
jgi:Rieske 2Fe-2S family protein